MTYARYPLDEITPEQACITFVKEVEPEGSKYEHKMIKFLMKTNQARITKVLKAYNYNKMSWLENQRGTCDLMFYCSSIEQMSKAIDNQMIYEQNFVLTPSLERSKQQFLQ